MKKKYPEYVQEYNRKTYGLISVRLPKDLVERFRRACVDRNVPQAQVIRKAVEEFLEEDN